MAFAYAGIFLAGALLLHTWSGSTRVWRPGGDLVLLLIAPLFLAPVSIPLCGLAVIGYQRRAALGWKVAGLCGLAGYVLLGSWFGSRIWTT